MRRQGTEAIRASAEIEELRRRLTEAEDTLAAIRAGEVDALVVAGDGEPQVYTLRGAETPYRRLVEEMQEGAATLADDGTILFANRCFAAMLRAPLERVVGSTLSRFLVRGDVELWRGLLQAGRGRALKHELELVAADGTRVPVQVAISPLPAEWDEGLCVIATDLTQRKRSEEILAEEQLARSILENAAEAIVVCDAQGRVIRANPAALHLCGEAAIGQPFEQAYPLATDAGGPSPLRAALRGEVVQGGEVRLACHGEWLDLMVSAGPLGGGGSRETGCVITLVDITDRKRAEEALDRHREELEQLVVQRTEALRDSLSRLRRTERLASIGTLAAGIAHEINNPLNSILLSAQYALRFRGEVDVEDILATIVDQAKRGGGIVEGVLKFAREEQTEKVPAAVNPVVRRAADLARSYTRSFGMSMELDLAPDLPPVRLNATELEQVLVNLIKNAAEAAEGHVHVWAKTAATEGGVRIEVRDDGPGIPEEGLAHIFDPFYSTRRDRGGTGLGLSICHSIVTDHGGSIAVESRPGEGATFIIHLPAAAR